VRALEEAPTLLPEREWATEEGGGGSVG